MDHESRELYEALNALEAMSGQYLKAANGEYDHGAMVAGELACAALCRLRPERWERVPRGMRFVGPGDPGVLPSRDA